MVESEHGLPQLTLAGNRYLAETLRTPVVLSAILLDLVFHMKRCIFVYKPIISRLHT